MSKITGATIFEKDVLAGAKCHGDIALKVLFILGCSPDQGTEILAAYGFCENSRKMPSGKNYSLMDLLCDWPKWLEKYKAMKNQFVA